MTHRTILFTDATVGNVLSRRKRGGYSLIWLIRGCAAAQGRVFGLFILNTMYNLCVCLKQGVYFVICPKQAGTLNEGCCPSKGILGYFRAFFVLNRARVSAPKRQPYTQTWV